MQDTLLEMELAGYDMSTLPEGFGEAEGKQETLKK